MEGMLDGMEMETFLDWRRHFHHAPWGEIRGDLRMSILATLQANAHRDPKKRSKAYEPKDFLAMTPSGRSQVQGRRVRAELPTGYQPTTPEEFASQSSALRATFGAQPRPTAQLLEGETDAH